MFGLGIPELIIILVVALLVFGPGKLPEIGAALGRGLRDFQKAVSSKDSEPQIDETSRRAETKSNEDEERNAPPKG